MIDAAAADVAYTTLLNTRREYEPISYVTIRCACRRLNNEYAISRFAAAAVNVDAMLMPVMLYASY